ncbi:MAG: tetratricopeptide repeat protein [Terriglobales bacterium]
MNRHARAFSKLATPAILGWTIYLAAQNPAAHAAPHTSSDALPKSCLISDGATDEVASALRALQSHPTAAAYTALGTLYFEANRLTCAIPAFEASLQLQRQNWQAHYYLAEALLRQGDETRPDQEMEIARAQGGPAMLATLRSDIEKDTAISKSVAVANRNLASGDASAAAQNYRNALARNPRDPKLHYNLAVALEKLGDVTSEQKELQITVALDPNIAQAQNRLGWFALHNGQQAQAELHLKKALAIDPGFAEAQNNLGVLYSQQGKDADAASLFQLAIGNDPSYAPAYVNYGLLLEKKSSLAEAEQQFRTAIKIDSNYADAFSALGMLQRKNGHGAEAVESLRQAVALDPSSARNHLDLGLALQDQSDRPNAFKEFYEAARLDPNLPAAHYNLGRFFFDSGKYTDAERELQTTLRLDPDNAGALFYLGASTGRQGQLERSTEFLKRTVALQPKNADAQYLLGQNLAHAGDNAGAIEHWKAAVVERPDFSQALFSLAKALNKIHDPDAKKYQNRFDAVLKNEQIADRVTELGNVALQSADGQKWPQALEQMNEAIALCGSCPQSAHLHKNLGLFYVRMGKNAEAKQELQTALNLEPNDADAKRALAKLDESPGASAK